MISLDKTLVQDELVRPVGRGLISFSARGL